MALAKLKELIKAGLRLFGLQLSRVRAAPPSFLSHHRIDLLLDVGANTGQYVLDLRKQGYLGRVVSFEPQPQAHKALKENAKSDPAWVVHGRCAIGRENGESDINIAGNSSSSSLLPMLAAHAEAAPESVYVGKDRTTVATLDSVFGDYYSGTERVFLKIDTQGYEQQVLDGARGCLDHIFGVQIELSTMPLYEAQRTYEYFFPLFQDAGFTLWSLIPVFTDRQTGQMLQFDAIFIRRR